MPPSPTSSVDCAYTIEGEGPPVFLVHGIGARRVTWSKLVDHLRERFTCIAYDLRGHGESPGTENPSFGLDDLVADLEALRGRLGIAKASILGHSLGGMIGPAYARAYPQRVDKIGLLSTAAFRTEDDSAKVSAVVKSMEDTSIPTRLDSLVNRWFTDDFQAKHPEVIALRKKQVLETDPAVFLNVFHIYAETEMSPWLSEVHHPCLVLTGELDGGCSPRLNRQIADALPNSKLVILDGMKHQILMEAPDKVASHVIPFLTGEP
ncbi:MAG: 3-oxoadipate enol-lactonase [Variibacter sp.]|jgi:pimeloyl-ACP methyl ester carboxylesterase|nr:3-oxoadipate enol-lactonase [Variibacter sp.]